MSVAQLIAFNLTLLAAIASPGPALIYALQSTLSSGRAVGMATGFGLAVMAATWTLLALVGLESVFRLFPWAYATLKIAGACYLIYVAWQTWRGASKPVGTVERPKARAFWGGVLVNLSNPKSVLFAAAVIVVIFPAGLAIADKALIAANHLAVELVFYTILALLISSEPVSRRYLKAKPWLDRIAAAILGGLGVRLLTDR